MLGGKTYTPDSQSDYYFGLGRRSGLPLPFEGSVRLFVPPSETRVLFEGLCASSIRPEDLPEYFGSTLWGEAPKWDLYQLATGVPSYCSGFQRPFPVLFWLQPSVAYFLIARLPPFSA